LYQITLNSQLKAMPLLLIINFTDGLVEDCLGG